MTADLVLRFEFSAIVVAAVTGTLVKTKGSGTGGRVRKPFPKSVRGWRRMPLPEYAVQACREALEDLAVTGGRGGCGENGIS